MPALENLRHEAVAQLLAAGKGAKEAYEGAGYKYKSASAHKIVHRESVRARVLELQAQNRDIDRRATDQAAKKLSLTKEWVIERLMYNAERALRGKPILDATGKHTGEFTGKPDGTVANRALELLGQHLNMFIQRHEFGQPGDFSRLTDAELDAKVRADAEALGLPPAMVVKMLALMPTTSNQTEH